MMPAAKPCPLIVHLIIKGVRMRYVILAPICAALVGAGPVEAQDDSQGLIDAQAYPSIPAPVVTPVSPPLVTGQSGCDAHQLDCRPVAGVAPAPALLPYHPPILPPPATLYGYFNSPPEHLHVWDSYPREVALRQWHQAAKERHRQGDRHHRRSSGHPYGPHCP